MKYVPSSPHLFRRIKIASFVFVGFVFLCSFMFSEPVDKMATISSPPNPAKAPWFFLWAQELVGYSEWFVYSLLILLFTMFFLPFIFPKPVEKATWFPKDQIIINLIAGLVILTMVTLTVLAILRGENWQLKGL